MRLPILLDEKIDALMTDLLESNEHGIMIKKLLPELDMESGKREDMIDLFQISIAHICNRALQKALEGQSEIKKIALGELEFRDKNVHPRNWEQIQETCHTVIGRSYRVLPVLHDQPDRKPRIQKERNWDTSFSLAFLRPNSSGVSCKLHMIAQPLKHAGRRLDAA